MKRSARAVRATQSKNRPSPKTHWRDRKWVRTCFAIGEIVGLVAIIVGLGWYFIEWGDRKETRRVNAETLQEIQDARIERAWSLVTNKASGNSGKKPALEYLNEQGVSLRGIDLSCETMGGGWNEDTLECARPTFLNHVELPGADLLSANLEGGVFYDANFNGANMIRADLSGAWLYWVDFSNAELDNSDLSKAILFDANLSNVRLENANLSSANLKNANLSSARLNNANLSSANLENTVLRNVDLWNADLSGVDLSNADLLGASVSFANLSRANLSGANFVLGAIYGASFEGAWAWSDKLPKGLAGLEIWVCQLGQRPLKKPESGCELQMME